MSPRRRRRVDGGRGSAAAGVILILATLPPGRLDAAPLALDPETTRVCATVREVVIPEHDRPAAAEGRELDGCHSIDLYTGIGQPADPVAARRCAFAEMQRPPEPELGGRAVLMMLYANGRGVERRYDVALKLACEIGGSPVDVAGRVHQLVDLRAAHYTGDGFHVCDHSSGRALYAACAALNERQDRRERDQQLGMIVGRWPERQRALFKALRAAADAFIVAHVRAEVDLSGTFEVQEVAFHDREFVARVDQFDTHPPGAVSPAEARAAAVSLDKAVVAVPQDRRDRVARTQALWVAYRDAWGALGRVRYPKVPAETWQTWLVPDRIRMLERVPER